MPPIKNKFLKKTICLGLSAALIYNTTVPAFGQEFFYIDNPAAISDHTSFNHTAAEIKAEIINHAREDYQNNLKQDAFARAEEIKKEIIGDEQKEIQKEHFEPQPQKIPTEAELKAEYVEQIQKLANDTKEETKQIYEESIKGVRNTADLANLKEQYQKALFDIDEHYNKEIDQINNNFKEFLQELKEGADEAFFQHVKELFNELMALYQQKPDEVKGQVLELTPVIVTLINKDKEHLYNQQQKQILLNLYRQVLEEENAKVGKDKNILTNACEIKGHCPELLNVIMGISILTPESHRIIDANMIFDTIENYKETVAGPAVLINSISGLLVMKDYDRVDKILKIHTKAENKFDFWDNLNFMAIPKALANLNGKYLGQVSQQGVYWSDDQKYQNIYTDIAQMLAEDGSKEALNILQKYGINKCLVERTSGVKKETLSKYSISCGGIKPFLVGALLSGKSGANKYSLPKRVEAKQYLAANGRIYNHSNNTNYRHNESALSTEDAYYSLAKEGFNGDAEAMLALHIMSQGMGDLNKQEEYALDTQLYKAFKGRIPEKFLHEKHIVIDEERLAKKENRQITRGIALGVGLAADVWLTVTFVADIALFGGKLVNFGKNLFNAFRMAKVGLTVKNIPALAKVAAKYTNTVFMRQKIVIKAKKFGRKLKKSSNKYRKSVRLNVLQNAGQYTNAVRQQAGITSNLARMGEAVTPDFLKMAKQITYDEKLGIFKIREVEGANVSGQVVSATLDIMDTATVNAKVKFRVAKMFKKKVDFKTIFLEEAEKLIDASKLAEEDKKVLLEFLKSDEANIGTLGAKVEKATRDFTENPLTLPVFAGAGNKKGAKIGADFVIGEKIPAFSEQLPEYVSVVEEDGRFVVKFFKNEKEVIDLSAFKLGFESTDSFVDFARASAELGNAGKIELKFIPKEADNFWAKNFKNVFARDKEKLFGGRGTVEILGKDGKTLTKTGITLKTYKQYDGLRLIIKENLGGAIDIYKGKNPLHLTTEGAFFLPKYQMGNFLNFAGHSGLKAPWKIKLMGGKNKINALYLQSMVSLSVASTGLIRPLSKSYPEMDMEQITNISLIFPYLMSALTPFVSPFVKKFGAVNILKTSMILSAASLALPIFVGFNGFGGIQADNPFEKPSPTLLYPSAALIGLATTLTRGSYSPIIQAIGGGSGTLKATAFKSIASFMLVLPPLIGAGIDKISPKYFKNSDGTLYLDENGQPVQKHWFDFSFSYPVMLAVAGAALYKVQKSQFNPNIGKSVNSFTNASSFFKDVGGSYKVLFRDGLWPLTIASGIYAGVESSSLYTYSYSMASEYIGNKVNTEPLVPVFALLVLNAPAFITRMNSKSILKAFGGDNMLGYRNLLTASITSAGTGIYLLSKQDNPLTFAAGLTLTSIGFSQVTGTILRYGHHKLALELAAPKHIVTSWDVSYPTIFLGMSLVSSLYSKMSDKNIDGIQTDNKSDMVSLKNSSWQEMMRLPIASLLLGTGLVYKGMRPKTALKTSNGLGLLAPFGLAAESQNPAFKNLVLPEPMINYNPQLKPFEPNLQYNPELAVPALKVQPDFTLQSAR